MKRDNWNARFLLFIQTDRHIVTFQAVEGFDPPPDYFYRIRNILIFPVFLFSLRKHGYVHELKRQLLVCVLRFFFFQLGRDRYVAASWFTLQMLFLDPDVAAAKWYKVTEFKKKKIRPADPPILHV